MRVIVPLAAVGGATITALAYLLQRGRRLRHEERMERERLAYEREQERQRWADRMLGDQ